MEHAHTYLTRTIALSRESAEQGGYPVGALVVLNDTIIGEGVSDGKQRWDATSHAEIDAIRNASQTVQKRNLTGATLYTSYEPCLMCFSACFWAYIDTVVFAVRKEACSEKYNECTGKRDLRAIDKDNRRHVELLHIPGLEAKALTVITA